eukprot:gene18735-6141_t
MNEDKVVDRENEAVLNTREPKTLAHVVDICQNVVLPYLDYPTLLSLWN